MILTKDSYRRVRGRLGEKFELDPLTEWTEIHNGQRDNDQSYTAWALYQVKSRTPKPATVAELEQQVDDLDAKLRDERADFDARYPGAQTAWTKVQDTDHELHDLREKLKKAAAKHSPTLPPPKPPAAVTNAPAATPVVNATEVKP